MYMKCFQAMGFLSRMLMPTRGKMVFKIESIGERVFLAHAASSLRGTRCLGFSSDYFNQSNIAFGSFS